MNAKELLEEMATYRANENKDAHIVLIDADRLIGHCIAYLKSTLPRPVDVENLPEGEWLCWDSTGVKYVGVLELEEPIRKCVYCIDSDGRLHFGITHCAPIPEVVK